jgi:HEAT repeat protein
LSQNLIELLSGGDRRSLARAKEALGVVRADPRGVAELVRLTANENWLVGMRAFDLLEKLAHENRALVEPHRAVFLGPGAESESWEVRLQIVRALPLFDWTPAERQRATAILLANVDHPQAFVRSWATDALAQFATIDPALKPVVLRLVHAMQKSDKGAIRTRAAKILERMKAEGGDGFDDPAGA